MNDIDRVLRAFKTVIKDWGIWEVFWMVVLFPWSLLYLLLRIIQELD